MKAYMTSNSQAQMTHAAWDAADACPDDEWEGRHNPYLATRRGRSMGLLNGDDVEEDDYEEEN